LLQAVTKASLVRQTCKHEKLAQVLNYKGSIAYDYQDKSEKPIFNVAIDQSDCAKLAEAEAMLQKNG